MAWPLLNESSEWAFYQGVRQGGTGRCLLLRALECPMLRIQRHEHSEGVRLMLSGRIEAEHLPGAATVDRARGSSAWAHARPHGGQARRSRRSDLPRTVRSGWRNAGKRPCIRPRVDRQRARGNKMHRPNPTGSRMGSRASRARRTLGTSPTHRRTATAAACPYGHSRRAGRWPTPCTRAPRRRRAVAGRGAERRANVMPSAYVAAPIGWADDCHL